MDCDREWLAEHTPIQTPLHIDAPHPNHTMRALVLHTSDAKTERLGTLFSSYKASLMDLRVCADSASFTEKKAEKVQWFLRSVS